VPLGRKQRRRCRRIDPARHGHEHAHHGDPL
jgi:hypothetical protein